MPPGWKPIGDFWTSVSISASSGFYPQNTLKKHMFFWGSVLLPRWQAQHFGCEKGTFCARAWRGHFNQVNVLLQGINMRMPMARNSVLSTS